MKIALMTYEGKLHTITDWNGKTEHDGMYLVLPGDLNHFTASLAILPEDVNEYETKCKEFQEKISQLQHELIKFKVAMHHKLIPLNKDTIFPK